MLTIVRSQPADATESGKRRAEIRQAAVELFDFDQMSRRLLGQRWTDASPEEQRDFVTLFTDLLERTYLNTLGNYRLATITFQGETISGSYAQVQSRMAAGKGEVAIEYRLLERDGQWAVYDVAVDGVSLISNYRSQFPLDPQAHVLCPASGSAAQQGGVHGAAAKLGPVMEPDHSKKRESGLDAQLPLCTGRPQ